MKNKFIVKVATLAAVAFVGLTPLTVNAASCTTNNCNQGKQTPCVSTVKSKTTCKTGTSKKNTCKKTNKKLKACKGKSCVVKVTKSTCKK